MEYLYLAHLIWYFIFHIYYILNFYCNMRYRIIYFYLEVNYLYKLCVLRFPLNSESYMLCIVLNLFCVLRYIYIYIDSKRQTTMLKSVLWTICWPNPLMIFHKLPFLKTQSSKVSSSKHEDEFPHNIVEKCWSYCRFSCDCSGYVWCFSNDKNLRVF